MLHKKINKLYIASGFTVIELIVIIVVIGILASFMTVQLGRTQLVARDKERADDISSIILFLENTYRTGQPDGVIIPTGDPGLTTATPMGYPSTALITTPTDAQSRAILGAIDQRALESPIKKAPSLVVATNASETTTGVLPQPSATNDVYVYQPMTSTSSLCTVANAANANQVVIAPRLIDACIRFNIYYFSEAEAGVKVKSSLNTASNGL